MNCLEKCGHSVIAFNAVAKGAKIDDKYKAIMDNKVIHRECFNKPDRYLFHLKQWKIQRCIEQNLHIMDFDIVHSHTLFNGGWATYQLHKKYNIPYVVTVRNTDVNVFLKIPLFKIIARIIIDNAAGVVFLSEAYKAKFLKICYKECDWNSILRKCDVIPNGLEPFWLNNIAEAKQTVHKPLELLCVGKIDKNKNIITTVQVVEKLNAENQDTHLTVIGQVLDENVKSLLDNSKNVSVVSYLKKEELISYYRNADIFVMPSFHESFGRVYAEAMTQGVPVIYTKGEGFDGFFANGTVGYSVKADSVDEIVSSVKRIIADYNSISRNCITKCQLFNWADITGRLEKLYLKSI